MSCLFYLKSVGARLEAFLQGKMVCDTFLSIAKIRRHVHGRGGGDRLIILIHCELKPSSRTYNFVEVSVHNLESSQT